MLQINEFNQGEPELPVGSEAVQATTSRVGVSKQKKKNKFSNSSIVIEVIRTVFIIIFILWRNFKHLKHEQKHLK